MVILREMLMCVSLFLQIREVSAEWPLIGGGNHDRCKRKREKNFRQIFVRMNVIYKNAVKTVRTF